MKLPAHVANGKLDELLRLESSRESIMLGCRVSSSHLQNRTRQMKELVVHIR